MSPEQFGAFAKEAASVSKLYAAAKSLGVIPEYGSDWRLIGKLIKKGKVTSQQEIAGPSKRFLEKVRARPGIEHAEVWNPGMKSRHYIKGSEGQVNFVSPKRLAKSQETFLAAVGGKPHEAAPDEFQKALISANLQHRRGSLHSHPDIPGIIAPDRQRMAAAMHNYQKSPAYADASPVIKSSVDKVRKVYDSRMPGVTPSEGDSQFFQAQPGLWHGIHDVSSGHTGHFKLSPGRVPRWAVSKPQ